MKRILTGLQPSGELTIGNLIGGINQIIKYQDQYDSFIFVPDLHAITVPQDSKTLHERIKRNVALYLASGVDPEKNTIYIQSESKYITTISWILECHTYIGEASRMTQFKDKSNKKENVSVGLLTYPILMAADIIAYDAHYIPVGADQKQHVELSRDISIRFNNKYPETFIVPEPIIPTQGAKIMDLQDPTKKMSKSAENPKGIIFLLDDLEVTRKKIMSSVTDSDTKVKYDPINKPGISNLITIYSCMTNLSNEEIENKFIDSNYGTFKKAVADAVVDKLQTIQDKYNEIINSEYLDDILDKGADITNKIAKEKLKKLKKLLGLYR